MNETPWLHQETIHIIDMGAWNWRLNMDWDETKAVAFLVKKLQNLGATLVCFEHCVGLDYGIAQLVAAEGPAAGFKVI